MNSIIKNFKDWSLLEAAAPSGSIFFASAATSASNVKPKLAADLGCKSDTLYTITFPGKDLLSALLAFNNRDGSKFGKSLAIDAGTPVKPGTDVMEIAGTKVEESGNVTIAKAQATGITSIKASNNGLLVLDRLAEGISAIADLIKAQPNAATNWAISLNLGGSIEDNSSRGYSVWYAKLPTAENEQTLSDFGNTIARAIAIAILSGSKTKTGASAKAFLNLNDPNTKDLYEKFVKDKTDPIAELIPSIVNGIRNRKILANQNATSQAASDLLTKFISEQSKNLRFPTGDTPVTLTPAGETAFAQICDEVVNSILPVSGPSDFANIPADVISSYAGLVKAMFGTRFKKADNFGWVQSAHSYTNAPAKTGTTGSVSAQKAEGEL